MLVPELQPSPSPNGHIFAPPAPPALSPLELELAARHVVNGWLDMRTTVRAPSWRQIVFGGRPLHFELPAPPPASLEALDQLHTAMPGDGPAARAKELLDVLQKARPRGAQPRTIAGRRQLPPSRDAMSSWLRRVFLITAGPDALRLLAAAGQLAPGDVTIMEAAYPEGLNGERMASVEAATALTAASMRGGHEAEIPDWLNDQMLTLMAEARPTAYYQKLYGQPDPDADDQQKPPGPAQQGPTIGAPPNSITTNAAPGVAAR